MIRTINGDIDKKELGWCQCHEHIFLEKGKSYKVSSVLCMDDFKKSLKELEDYKKAGGTSIVDAQPLGCGRMVKELIAASKKSQINIIASTGFHKQLFYEGNHWIFNKKQEDLIKIFENEISKGLYDNEILNYPLMEAKAGIIKTAIDEDGIYKNKTSQKLFECAAEASLRTQAPLLCHIDKSGDAFEVINFFTNYGIKPRKIIICHLDRMKYDFKYHEEVASAGVFLEYDTIHRLKYHTDKEEIDLIKNMVEKGYKSRLLLGMDTTNKRLKSYGASFGLDFILSKFKNDLEKYGINENIINVIMIKNPADALNF